MHIDKMALTTTNDTVDIFLFWIGAIVVTSLIVWLLLAISDTWVGHIFWRALFIAAIIALVIWGLIVIMRSLGWVVIPASTAKEAAFGKVKNTYTGV